MTSSSLCVHYERCLYAETACLELSSWVVEMLRAGGVMDPNDFMMNLIPFLYLNYSSKSNGFKNLSCASNTF